MALDIFICQNGPWLIFKGKYTIKIWGYLLIFNQCLLNVSNLFEERTRMESTVLENLNLARRGHLMPIGVLNGM